MPNDATHSHVRIRRMFGESHGQKENSDRLFGWFARKTLVLLCVVTLAGAVPTAAVEQEADEPETGSTPEQPFVERLRVMSDPIDRTPGSVSYLNEEQLRRQHYTDIHRVLSLLPGVNLQEEDGYGLRPNIGIRGSGTERSQKITLLEDGILIAPAPYAAPAAYYFPTAGRMSGIEVRKGSSAIRQGPYTNGGVLNLMSSPIPGRFSGDIEIVAGSDSQIRGRGRVGDSTERFGWLVETFHQQTDGFKSLDGGGATGFDLSDYMFKLRVNTGSKASHYQSLELKVGRTEQVAHQTYVGLTEADFNATPYRRYAGSREDRLDTDHDQVQLIYVAKPSAKIDVVAAVYRNTFFRNWHKLQSVNGVGLGPILDDPGTYATEFAQLRGDVDSVDDALHVRNNRRDYRSQGIQTILGVKAGARHDIEFGLRYHEDYEDRFQEEEGFRMENGAMVQTSTGAPGSQSNRISDAEALAFFVRDTIRAGKWTLSPGVRLETIDLRRRDFGTTDPQRTGAAMTASLNEVRQWIPGFGATYEIDRQSSWFAGVHRGFSPPGPAAGADTDPEKSVNYEVGYRRESGLTRFEAAAYFNDYQNLLGADTLSSGGTKSVGSLENT